jgi:Zn-dependent protease with chaperone function
MILLIVLGLFTAAALLTLVAPAILSAGRWWLSFPRVALVVWFATFVVAVVLIAAALVVSVWSVVDSGRGDSQVPFEPTGLALLGWVGLAGVGGLITLVAARITPFAGSWQRTYDELGSLASVIQVDPKYGPDVVVVDSPLPLAVSIPGGTARILITTRLEKELSAAELRAVIEHERAHLAHHHGRISQLAKLNRACMPSLPAATALQRNTQLLVELIADDSAARRIGAVNTANALRKIGELQHDDSMLLRAQRLASRPPRGSLLSARRVRRTLSAV